VSPNLGQEPPWRLQLEGVWERERITFTTDALFREVRPGDHPLSANVASCVLLRSDPIRLAQPSYSERRESRVEYDGYGLASALSEIALNCPDEFQALQDAVRDVIPAVERLRFDKVGIRKNVYESARRDSSRGSRRFTGATR